MPDLRLTSMEAVILDLLARAKAESYGLDLVRRSGGGLKVGTVYVTLQRMEQRGIVASRPEQKAPHVPGIPRRMYRPTAAGRTLYRAWRALQG